MSAPLRLDGGLALMYAIAWVILVGPAKGATLLDALGASAAPAAPVSSITPAGRTRGRHVRRSGRHHLATKVQDDPEATQVAQAVATAGRRQAYLTGPTSLALALPDPLRSARVSEAEFTTVPGIQGPVSTISVVDADQLNEIDAMASPIVGAPPNAADDPPSGGEGGNLVVKLIPGAIAAALGGMVGFGFWRNRGEP